MYWWSILRIIYTLIRILKHLCFHIWGEVSFWPLTLLKDHVKIETKKIVPLKTKCLTKADERPNGSQRHRLMWKKENKRGWKWYIVLCVTRASKCVRAEAVNPRMPLSFVWIVFKASILKTQVVESELIHKLTPYAYTYTRAHIQTAMQDRPTFKYIKMHMWLRGIWSYY